MKRHRTIVLPAIFAPDMNQWVTDTWPWAGPDNFSVGSNPDGDEAKAATHIHVGWMLSDEHAAEMDAKIASLTADYYMDLSSKKTLTDALATKGVKVRADITAVAKEK